MYNVTTMCVDALPGNADIGPLMAIYRTILAGLIALAVALAPIGVALAAGQTQAMPGMEDCQGKASKDCPGCDAKAACPGDACGVKCCKLVGMVALPPRFSPVARSLDRLVDLQKPPDRLPRPQPPPPRS